MSEMIINDGIQNNTQGDKPEIKLKTNRTPKIPRKQKRPNSKQTGK